MTLLPLRILHLLAPASHGGLESVVTALGEGLRARGHRVVVGAVVDPDVDERRHPFLSEIAARGLEARVLKIHARSYLKEIAWVRSLIRDVRPHVLHSHGYRPDVIDAPLAGRMGTPTITTVHGFTSRAGKARVYEAIQKWAFRRMDAVVAVSRPLVELLERSGVKRERVHLIPNALAANGGPAEPAAARARLGGRPGEFHIGWVGRLSREKGPDVFLAALAGLRELPWSASIVGDGPLAAELRTQEEALGLRGRIRWHGMVDRAGRELSGLDCLVLSSRTEGTPIVLLEAMAAGVPVVATAVGGVPDAAQGVALLVPPEAPAALADALRQVLGDPAARLRMAAAGHQRLEQAFDPGRWVERYEAIYRGLAGAGTDQ